ncbi:MAG: DUF4263 domain-containing protein [bacterium]|nr:DUF4263 domain-containing protein [bacterium]
MKFDDLKNIWKEIKPSEEDFTAMQKEEQIKVSSWNESGGKYVAVVSDSAHTLEDNARYKYLASYITQKDEVIGIKLQRFKKDQQGSLLPEPQEFSIPFKQAHKLADFLQFLKEANLGSLTSGNFQLVDKLELDPDLYAKLVTLSSDEKGQQSLQQLINDGYLHLNLDLSELIKKGISVSKIDERLQKLDVFERMLSNKDLKEVKDIQTELKKMPWIFGPEYISYDVRDAGEDGVPDGRLKRIDGLSDVLEMKLPSAKLLKQDDKHPSRQHMYAELAQGLGQLTGYLEYYDSEYSTERDDEGNEIMEDMYAKYYKPKGILLIGRRETAHPKRLRRLLSYFHRIEVLTYDDLLDRARNGLNNLKTQREP